MQHVTKRKVRLVNLPKKGIDCILEAVSFYDLAGLI